MVTQDRKWVVISALIVAGIWGWRRAHEGQDKVMPAQDFMVAWGGVFFTLSVIGEAWPQLANAFAISIAGADLLVNAPAMLPANVRRQYGIKATNPPKTDSVKGSH